MPDGFDASLQIELNGSSSESALEITGAEVTIHKD